MNQTLSRYFKTKPAVQDGLRQTQREAIVDLLNFCRIADEKLLAAEERVSATEEATFNWESEIPLVAYAFDSLERAQRILRSRESRIEFLNDVAQRLATTETKSRAICFCQDMFVADGEFAEEERAVFQEIKQALGWPDQNTKSE